MSRLNPLRRRLSLLRTARFLTQWTAGLCAIIVGVLLLVALTWGLDVLFELSRMQRGVTAVVCTLALAWVFIKFTWPQLIAPESPTDLTLFVEQQHRLDNDLIAALDFDQQESQLFGSRQLADSVVERALKTSHDVNVFAGFPLGMLKRRCSFALVAALIAGALAFAFPNYLEVFAQRWLYAAGTHYPTQTQIISVAVNGQTVLDSDAGNALSPSLAKAAQSQPLEIVVVAGGDIPDQGDVRLVATGGSAETILPLSPIDVDEPTTNRERHYRATLERLNNSLAYQIKLGDAWTEPAPIEMIPLPIVQMQIVPHPPAYATQAGLAQPELGQRSVQVLEGTRVDLAVRCVNDKLLKSVSVTVEQDEEPWTAKFIQSTDDPTFWQFNSDAVGVATNPFRNVDHPIRFTLNVVDVDELRPTGSLQGSLRIKADRPPSGSARLVHRVVLPSAQPVIEYRANDDFGVAAIRLHVTAEKPTAEFVAVTSGVPSDDETTPDSPTQTLNLTDGKIIGSDQLPLESQYVVELSSFELEKGDRLKLELEIVDHRGTETGEAFRADPLYLEISDESGVLSAISESDERSEKQLSDIIKRELGIGGSP